MVNIGVPLGALTGGQGVTVPPLGCLLETAPKGILTVIETRAIPFSLLQKRKVPNSAYLTLPAWMFIRVNGTRYRGIVSVERWADDVLR